MSSRVLKLFIALHFVGSIAGASGGEEKPKEGAPTAKEVKSAEESFNVVQARVLGLEAKVRSAENEIKKLIEEKQRTKDPEKQNEVIRQMISVHKQLESLAKEYDQQRALLNYRYPEKGQSEKRKYQRHEVKSIEEMEGQMSLSKSVQKTMKKVRTQYENVDMSASSTKAKSQKETKTESNPKINEKSDLLDPVILKK